MSRQLVTALALVALAAPAAAEVRFSGDARMGLNYDSGATSSGVPVAGGNTVRLEKRFTLNIDGSVKTDGGVTLGARVRIRSDEADANNTAAAAGVSTGVSGARVFASGFGLTVAAGNILGAIDVMPNTFAEVIGLTGNGDHGNLFDVSETREADRHNRYDRFSSSGNGAEGIEAIYRGGPFAFHASFSTDGLRNRIGTAQRLAAHAAYTFEGFTLAVAFQDSNVDSEDIIGGTLAGKFGQFTVGLGYAANGSGTAVRIDKYALNVAGSFGPTTVNAYVASQSFSSAVITSPTTWGLGLRYDLGGGTQLAAGIEGTPIGTVRADAGVSFRF